MQHSDVAKFAEGVGVATEKIEAFRTHFAAAPKVPFLATRLSTELLSAIGGSIALWPYRVTTDPKDDEYPTGAVSLDHLSDPDEWLLESRRLCLTQTCRSFVPGVDTPGCHIGSMLAHRRITSQSLLN